MAQFPNTDNADGIWTLKKQRRAVLGNSWPTFVPIINVDSAEDTNFSVPELEAITAGDQISGDQYWRTIIITPSATGTFRLYMRIELIPTAGVAPRNSAFNGDLQVAGVDVAGTLYKFTDAQTHNYEAASSFATGDLSEPTSWTAIANNADPSGGLFGLKFAGGATGSTRTGRLIPPSFIASGATTLSYAFFETSSPVAFGDYLWARSPAYSLTAGDEIRIYYGTDCPTVNRFFVELK